jgi:hypothetical protein
MRGRPARELLRRFTLPTAAAVALVVVPAAVAAGGPSPDRAPSAPSTLAPDPAPGATVPHSTSAPVTSAPPPRTPVSIPQAVTHVNAQPRTVKRAAVVHHARKRAPAAKPKPAPVVRFALPRIAVPSLAAVVAVPASHDAEVALAGLALLLAAVTAGSGARLVAVWSRRG